MHLGLVGLRERGWTRFWMHWCNWQHIWASRVVLASRVRALLQWLTRGSRSR
ncbi:hypothetical protein BC830DRAFT_1159224, partial [Chytriomyces sp. MP71]